MYILNRLESIIGDSIDIEEGSSIKFEVLLDDLRMAIKELRDYKDYYKFVNEEHRKIKKQACKKNNKVTKEYREILEILGIIPVLDHTRNVAEIRKLSHLVRKKSDE